MLKNRQIRKICKNIEKNCLELRKLCKTNYVDISSVEFDKDGVHYNQPCRISTSTQADETSLLFDIYHNEIISPVDMRIVLANCYRR